MIVSELPSEVASTDEAFKSAMTPKYLGDLKLEPYSLMRQVVAWEVCAAGSHPLAHPIIHVWVCTLKEKAVMALRRDREQAFIDGCRWAESQGYIVGWMDELIEIYNQMHEEVAASSKAIRENRDHAPKNDGALRS